MTAVVRVGNLPRQLTAREFQQRFQGRDGCINAYLLVLQNASSSVGFLEFKDEGCAITAIKRFHGWQGWGTNGGLDMELWHSDQKPQGNIERPHVKRPRSELEMSLKEEPEYRGKYSSQQETRRSARRPDRYFVPVPVRCEIPGGYGVSHGRGGREMETRYAGGVPFNENVVVRGSRSHVASAPPNATLHIGGLPPDITARELAHIFRPFEGFMGLKLFTKHVDTQTRISGFCTFDSVQHANAAMQLRQGYAMDMDKDETYLLRISYAVRRPM